MNKEQLERMKEELLAVLKKEAFFKEGIILSSGKSSNYYIDARTVTLSPKGAYLCASIILEMIKDEGAAAVGGPTIGADPIVGAISTLSFINKSPINTFIIRKSPKAHGRMKQIEGPLIPKGSKVALIDDVATTGKSLVEAINILRRESIEVVKAIVMIDRQEGASNILQAQNCPLVSIFKASDFIS